MQTIGITGGAGFIGSYVAEECLRRGYHPVLFDPRGRATLEGYEVYLGDVRDANSVTEFAAHVDGVIHLAAVLGTAETINNPRPSAETNVIGTLNVLEAVTQYGLPMAYAGVGNARMALGTYVISKTAGEDFCRMFAQYRDTKVNVVRPMNAYGPRQSVAAPYGHSKVRKITPSFICRAISGQPIEVYGTGQQISDMVYVGDVATSFVNALEEADKGHVLPITVEIGPKDSTTVRQVAYEVSKLVAAATGKPPVTVVELPMRPGEQQYGILTTAAAEEFQFHVMRLGEEAGTLALQQLRQVAKPVHNKVRADTTTLSYINMSADDLMPLKKGLSVTVDWFLANEGQHWNRVSDAPSG